MTALLKGRQVPAVACDAVAEATGQNVRVAQRAHGLPIGEPGRLSGLMQQGKSQAVAAPLKLLAPCRATAFPLFALALRRTTEKLPGAEPRCGPVEQESGAGVLLEKGPR